ncbi:tetratricopeptide repeat protein [Rhodobacteraceae bacterium IMCC15231]|nr:tetratricopeptide repeat protein [Rhodobacteraceae bacterium IMCC15231]
MTQSVDKTLHDAAALHKAGRIAEAIKLYQAVLTKFPKNPRALKALAMLKGVSAPARADAPDRVQCAQRTVSKRKFH